MASYIVTDRIRVNIVHSFAVPPRVKCEQYDGDYTKLIQAIVYNGDVLYNIPNAVRRVVISGLKPDGNGFSYDCTWSGNTVSFSLMRQMTAVNGVVPCNITMFDSENNQVSSAVFVLDVEKAALPSDVVVSSNDFQTFIDYVQAANLYWQYSKSYAVGNTGVREDENVDNAKYYAHLARMYKGSPLSASTISEMVDTERVYVYVGNESGYNNGHWYFYNDSEWTDGGVYNSQGQQTDTELITPDIAADAKAVGDRLAFKLTEYANVASMIADENIKVGEHVKTAGYYNAGDKGGAYYDIVNEQPSEEVYYVTLSSGKYAILNIENVMTFEMFGAYGDGTHDDSVAIQKAILCCGSINAIGIYAIKNVIELNRTGDITPELGTQKNCLIVGRGKNISLMNSVASLSEIDENESTFLFDGGYFHLRGTSRVDFTNCVFMGKKTSLKTENAFMLTDPARKLNLNDCTFANLDHAIYCDNNGRWSGESIYRGLYFALCRYGIYYENGGKDCIINSCIAQGNTDYFVMLKDALGCLFSENHDYSANGTYLYYGASIVNNYFDGLNKLHIKTSEDVSGSSTGKHSSHGVDIVGNIFLTNLHNTTYTGIIACIVVDNDVLMSTTICNNILHGGADNADIALIDMTNVDYTANNVIYGNTGMGLNALFKNVKNSAVNYYRNQYGDFTPHVTIDSSLTDVRKTIIRCNGGFIIIVRINNPTNLNSGAITIDNCPSTTDINSITLLTKNDDSVAVYTNSSLSDYTIAGKKQVSIYFVNMGTADIAEMLFNISEA